MRVTVGPGGLVLSPDEAQFEIANEWLGCLKGLRAMSDETGSGVAREQWEILVDRSTRLLAVVALVDTQDAGDQDRLEWLEDLGLAAVELIRLGAEAVMREGAGSSSSILEEGLAADDEPKVMALGFLAERQAEMSRLLEAGGQAPVSAGRAECLDAVASGMNPLRVGSSSLNPKQAEVRERYLGQSAAGLEREEFWSDTLADWQSYARRRLPALIGGDKGGTLPFLAAIASLDSIMTGRTVGFYEGVATLLPDGPPLLPEDEGAGH